LLSITGLSRLSRRSVIGRASAMSQASPPRTVPGRGRGHAWGQRGGRRPDPRPRRAAAARRRRL